MAYTTTKKGYIRPPFLESEVGLITKTYQADSDNSSVITDTDGTKMIRAGSVYPSNDAKAIGIVFEDVDVTYGEHAVSVMVAGRVNKDVLNISSEAETALKANGIFLIFTEEAAEDIKPKEPDNEDSETKHNE